MNTKNIDNTESESESESIYTKMPEGMYKNDWKFKVCDVNHIIYTEGIHRYKEYIRTLISKFDKFGYKPYCKNDGILDSFNINQLKPNNTIYKIYFLSNKEIIKAKQLYDKIIELEKASLEGIRLRYLQFEVITSHSKFDK